MEHRNEKFNFLLFSTDMVEMGVQSFCETIFII